MSGNGTRSNGTHSQYTYPWRPEIHGTIAGLAVVNLISNSLVILLYFKSNALRNSAANTLLAGLALVDILCAVVMSPAAILCDVDVFGNEHRKRLCIFYYICNLTISVASVYHIVAATIAKYLAIMHPIRNLTALTPGRGRQIMLVIWLVSLLIGHTPSYWPLFTVADRIHMWKLVNYILLAIAVVIPIIIIIIIHLHILVKIYMRRLEGRLSVCDQEEKGKRRKNSEKIASMFVILFVVFVITWLPWYLVGAGLLEDKVLLLVLRFVGPCLNPLVFTLVKNDFQNYARSLLRKKRPDKTSISSRLTAETSFQAAGSAGDSRIKQHPQLHSDA